MTTFKSNTDNKKTTKPISKGQNNNKQSNNIYKMQESRKFRLTTQTEYNIIKGKIETSIRDAFLKSGVDIGTFANNLGIQQDSLTVPDHIALLTPIYTLNEKINKLQSITLFSNRLIIHSTKSNLYILRCAIINLIHGLLPQAQTTASTTEIKKYILKGFNATLNIEDILNYLETISLDEIEEFSKLFEEYQKNNLPEIKSLLTQEKYVKINELLNSLMEYNLQSIPKSTDEPKYKISEEFDKKPIINTVQERMNQSIMQSMRYTHRQLPISKTNSTPIYNPLNNQTTNNANVNNINNNNYNTTNTNNSTSRNTQSPTSSTITPYNSNAEDLVD